MPEPTKMSDLPNFKRLEAMALEVGRMFSESKELCEALAADQLRYEERYYANHPDEPRAPVNTDSTMYDLLAKEPFYLTRKFMDI